MQNTEQDNDLGTLVSEKMTLYGFGIALLDVMIMGINCAALLYFLEAFGSYKDISLESVAVLAVGLMFLGYWVRDWMRVTSPKGNYEYERVFKKDGKTTVMVGRHLFDSE
jgi:hypothetical protein